MGGVKISTNKKRILSFVICVNEGHGENNSHGKFDKADDIIATRTTNKWMISSS